MSKDQTKIVSVDQRFRLRNEERKYDFVHRSQLPERLHHGWKIEGGEIMQHAVGHLYLVSKRRDGQGVVTVPVSEWNQMLHSHV